MLTQTQTPTLITQQLPISSIQILIITLTISNRIGRTHNRQARRVGHLQTCFAASKMSKVGSRN